MARIESTVGRGDSESRRLRGSARRLGRGLYAVDADRTDADRLATRARAALLVAPPGSLVCGATALALAGVRLPQRVAALARGPVQVVVPRESGWHSRRPELLCFRSRTLPPRQPRGLQGIAMALLPHCWMQITAQLMRGPGWDPTRKHETPTTPGVFLEPRKTAFLEAVQVGDRLMARKNPLVAHGDFASYVRSAVNVRGVGSGRVVFGHLRPGTDSTMESWLRLVVWDAGFPDPVVNHPVTAAGRSRFLDLAWPELMIDLEFHGRQHFHEWEQAYNDVHRRGQLQVQGWTTIEATEDDLISPGALLYRLGVVFTARRTAR
jgi:hypothetical protein